MELHNNIKDVYRKNSLEHQRFVKGHYRKYPKVYESMFNRHIIYNNTLDELEDLER